MKGKYQMRAVVNFVVEADNRAAAHIVAVDALTAAELDGFDLDSLSVSGPIRPGDFAAPALRTLVTNSVAPGTYASPDGPIVVTPREGTSESTDYLARP